MFDIFTTLASKIAPLYVLIFFGYLARKALQVQGHNIANLMFYFFVPITIFHGVWRSVLTPTVLLLPLLVFAISTLVCLTFLQLGRRIYPDARANILALSAGVCNCGYFGLPVAILLFPPDLVGIYITSFLGMTLFQNSIGMYVAARGRYSARDAFRKTLTLPTLYGFILAVALNFSHVPVPDLLENIFRDIRGAYTVLGMMMIGIGIGQMVKFRVEWGFLALTFLARFVAFPAVVALAITLDQQWLHWFDANVYKALLLIGLVPLAADTVAIATMLDSHPEAMSSAVLLSTLFALVYVPLMATFFL